MPVSLSHKILKALSVLLQEKNKAGDLIGDTEKTSTDKKRERRYKKKAKRLKIQEKEKRNRIKEANKTRENKKLSKAELTESMKKLTKGGKAKILKVSTSFEFTLDKSFSEF